MSDYVPKLGKKTKRMRRLAKQGLFAFLATDKPVTHRPLLALEEQQRKLWQKRGEQQPVALDGKPLPNRADGWMLSIPNDSELFVTAITCLKLSDGTNCRWYRMMVKPQVVKAKRKAAKKLMQRIERENREMAKRRVRALLIMLGKA